MKISKYHVFALAASLLTTLPLNAAHARAPHTLYDFRGNEDGFGFSVPPLTPDGAGNLYGVTGGGGSSNRGTVFVLSPDGKKTILWDFAGKKSGLGPEAPLYRDNFGDLFSTTLYTSTGGDRGGTVFKVSGSGRHRVLHTFSPTDPAGYMPGGRLVEDNKGNIFGLTQHGGKFGGGTLFRLSPTGHMSVLYAFENDAEPNDLIMGKDGRLYGTTSGLSDAGCFGTFFQADLRGRVTTLHCFMNIPDGAFPFGYLSDDGNGNIYGLTFNGGLSMGTVYRIAVDGRETIVHNFSDKDESDPSPSSPLAIDAHGNVYGIDLMGGLSAQGSIFRISPNGAYLRLFSFDYENHREKGIDPQPGLVFDSSGYLVGAAGVGGKYNAGTIFSFRK